MSGVLYRTGLEDRDYNEAISALQDAQRQPAHKSEGCTVCCSSDHTAESCHHNPLVMARRAVVAARVWRCFHCDAVFTDAKKAEEHFGFKGMRAAHCLENPDAPFFSLTAAQLNFVHEWLRQPGGHAGTGDLTFHFTQEAEGMRVVVTNNRSRMNVDISSDTLSNPHKDDRCNITRQR